MSATQERIPPHAPAAEISVLGAALQDQEAAKAVVEVLRFGDYFLDNHRLIHGAIAALLTLGQPVDLVTVGTRLQERGQLDAAGNPSYLASLVEQVPTAANVRFHAAIIQKAARKRQLIEVCTRTAAEAYEDDTDAGPLTADLWERLRVFEETAQGPGPVLVQLADVLPEDVSWLWPGRLPIGKLSMVVGDPGLGKSFMTLDFACRTSRGDVWPDGEKAQLGDVILLSAEDGIADTIRRRVDALDGDPGRIHVLTGVGTPEKPNSFNLAEDLVHLEDAILRTRAILVVVDPLSAYLGTTDSHRDSEVRGILAPLSAMAERNRVAIVCVVHMNKSQQRQALYRAQGSLAFVAAARAVFGVAEDRDNPGRRLLVPMKMNLAPKPPALAFRIDGGFLTWVDGAIEVDTDRVMAGEEKSAERSALEDAKDFLRQELADGPVEVKRVKDDSEEALIKWRTVERAKESLKVESIHPRLDGPWYWTLSAKETLSKNVGVVGRTSSDLADKQVSLVRQGLLDRQLDRQGEEWLADKEKEEQIQPVTTTTYSQDDKTAKNPSDYARARETEDYRPW